MTNRIPSLPTAPPCGEVRGEMSLRYEDICQDGRLVSGAMPAALGSIFWRQAVKSSGLGQVLREEGVIPILTRLVTAVGEGPISVNQRLSGVAHYVFATLREPDGDVARIVLDVWIDIEAERGLTHGPPPEGAGEKVRAGRVFAEHTFTRIFAPPGERKVRRLPKPLPELPEHERAWKRPGALLSIPEGAQALDENFDFDAALTVFGHDHTDSNQHVNSLVYPRIFREAALRCCAKHGEDTARLAIVQETSFRKPCFAGDEMRIATRAFRTSAGVGVACCLLPRDATSEAISRAHAFGHVIFA